MNKYERVRFNVPQIGHFVNDLPTRPIRSPANSVKALKDR